MKNIAVLVVVLLAVAACNTKEGAGSFEKAEGAKAEAESVVLEAYMPTDDVDVYGHLEAFIKMKNNSDEAVLINEGDFALYDTASDTEFKIVIDIVGDDGKPLDIALASNKEKYVIGSFDISSKKRGATEIDLEDYEMHYLGDAHVEQDSVAVQLDLENKYSELVNSSGVISITVPSGESEDWAAYEGSNISVYGPLDDKEAYVRVENTSSSNINFDSSGLYVYDPENETSYGIDPNATDAAFKQAMTLKPGQIVDYREFFFLEEAFVQVRSENDEDILITMYAPEDPEVVYAYGHYYHEDDLPEDFRDDE